MPSLFNLADELIHLRHVLESREDGEIDEALESWLNSTEGQLREKVGNYCAVIEEFKRMAEVRWAECARLKMLADADQAKADRMRRVLFDVLQRLQIDHIETDRHKVGIRTAGGQPALQVDTVDMDQIPEQFLRTQRAPNREAIREALERGEELPFARLLPRSKTLMIR